MTKGQLGLADLPGNLIFEAENVVNSRPLTYQPMDPDLNEAITPNHLLRMTGKLVITPPVGEDELEHGKRVWRFSQQMANEFWRRFVLEYLADIMKRTKWNSDQRMIQEGNMVIIVDEQAKRNTWEKRVVGTLHIGTDRKRRTATVKTERTITKRPVVKLRFSKVCFVICCCKLRDVEC
jgi:hypothetical protein